MTIERGNILRILPQIGDAVCLKTDKDKVTVAVPIYGTRGISGYSKESFALNSFSIGKRSESVEPEGSDDQVFERAVEAKYLNPQIDFD